MIGGIFLEIPFGDVYKVETVSHIRTSLNKLLGFDPKFFTKGNWDKEIATAIYNIAKESIGRHRGDIRREHLSRSGDLIRSTAMSVFVDGQWDGNIYRFTGGPDHEAEPYSWAKHPDLDMRAGTFMSTYELMIPSRFSVVIAVTMPYAVRVEANGDVILGDFGHTNTYYGYNLAVLKYGINRIGNDIFAARPDSMKGKAQYGYIFETTGTRKVIKPNVA